MEAILNHDRHSHRGNDEKGRETDLERVGLNNQLLERH